MSLYQGFAQQKGFGAYHVDIPDPSEKIRRQGLEAMKGMEAKIQSNAEQAQRLLTNFEQNAQIEASQRQANFELRTHYAQTMAAGKWKNYETAIKNAETRAKGKQKDWEALLSLTKSGAQLAKMGIDHNRKVTDGFVDQIYRDYGIGWKQFQFIQGLQDEVIQSGADLQGLLRKMEIRGNVPMDVIQRIRRGGGYMNLAVNKTSARRWANSTLKSNIAARSSEPLDLPGMPKGLTLNSATGPNLETALQYLVSDEIRKLDDPQTGEARWNNKVLALAGISGPDGTIARLKANYIQKDVERTQRREYADRHNETITILKDFMGPQGGSPDVAGARGIQGAIYFLAGGMDAPGNQLSIARNRVVDSIDAGLRNGQLTWEEVRGLGDLDIYPRGTNGKSVKWSKHFSKDWGKIVAAGEQFYENEEAELALETAHLKLEGKEFLGNMREIVQSGEYDLDTLIKFSAYAENRGHHFDAAKTYLNSVIAKGKTTINDDIGSKQLIARANRGEIITDDEIDRWNFSDGVASQVKAEVVKHNNNLPQQGTNGTYERLESFIDGELKTIIPPKSGYQHNSTHKDAKIGAMREAALHYRTARESGKSHEDAYDYAKGKIHEDLWKEGGRWHKKTKNGVAYFNDFGPKDFDTIDLNREQLGARLHNNPDAIYTEQMINESDLKEISAQAQKGIYRPVHNKAMLIQSLTRGNVSGVEAMQAQLQLIRDRETQELGAPTTQLLPQDYVNRYSTEVKKIHPLATRLLNTYNLADVNKAYVRSGYQPPNQNHYYNKIYPMVETGDYNNVMNAEGQIVNSNSTIKASISNASIRQVLQIMENGWITHAGNALFDYESLKAAVEGSGIGWEAKFNADNQRKLTNWKFKNNGLASFGHVEPDEYNIEVADSVNQNLNTDKIDGRTFYRSMGACNTEACSFMKANPQLFGIEE